MSGFPPPLARLNAPREPRRDTTQGTGRRLRVAVLHDIYGCHAAA